MELKYHQILLLAFISSASCSQSTFKLPSLSTGRYKGKECEQNFWKCPGENKCIKLSELCDGKNDCMEGGDESPNLCTKEFCKNELDKWKCPGESKVKYDN